ncbi:TolB family protein [Stackebrandtia nassauensis]|uniref:WD40 domain protein beta Propeller n=1 Tax=Stackebrandtia nassauensis (strain DSM 44728 / CIP 108903 / NRRL B-16338 / NBRC 102104 / LLR-40K-21) TaxID=446470 RepID=D3Q8D9_STANL|nr:PD40 domain-containing protein [Stackebrandtia nassauensis]ADD42513.1 hypothetical protein Snas_2837 [Stackebrandtia nassauensis DSM 44728]
MTTRFRDDLVHMASEVRDADLAARARAGSRRRRNRNVLIGCAVLLVAAPLAVVGATSFAERREDAAEFGDFDGTFVYLRDDTEDDGAAELVRRDGTEESTVLSVPSSDITGDISVSADGEWAAWERQGNGDTDIMVADLSTGDTKKLLSHSSNSCVAPTWAPDGAPLLLTPDPDSSTGAVRWNNVESEESTAPLETITERADALCPTFPVARSDGDYDLYYSTGEPFRLRYLAPDGSFHDVEGVGKLRDAAGDYWADIAGVSRDGDRVCLTAPHEDDDVSFPRCDAVVDPGSGKVLRDRRKDPATQVLFLPNGESISRNADGVMERCDADGEVVARTQEDSRWRDHRLMAYVPD